MAKKRKKKKKEEGYEFKMPEFDEDEYLRKEVRDARALFVTLGYAVLIGLISFGLTFVDVALAVLVGFIAIVFLRHIYPMFRVDTMLIEKKTWAGNIIMYLFTWLAIWILLCNPPFSDFAAPTIEVEGIFIENYSGNWTGINKSNELEWDGRDLITSGTNVSINVTIVDNVKVDVDTIRIYVNWNNGNITPEGVGAPLEKVGENKYKYIFYADPQEDYDFTITASDVNNNKMESKPVFIRL